MLNDCLYIIISLSIIFIFRFLLFLTPFWSWTTLNFSFHRGRLFLFLRFLSSLRSSSSRCGSCNTRRLCCFCLFPRRCWRRLMNHWSSLWRHWYLWWLNLYLWLRSLSWCGSLSRQLFSIELLLRRLLDRHH